MSSIVVFAEGSVGLSCVQWLTATHAADLAAIVTTGRDEIARVADLAQVETFVWDEPEYLRWAGDHRCDLGLLLWWPHLIKSAVIDSTNFGWVNTHPALLPHCRGKHTNFWAMVEQRPFGVTLHRVTEGIDAGDVVAQRNVPYTWEDTAETLYKRGQTEMVRLFRDTYPQIRELRFDATPQDFLQGSMHYGYELDRASTFSLDEPTTARRLLNLLRARTFPGYPACRFSEGGFEYEVRVEIKQAS
jgi:methionyl-tRNA formyltransferase